MSKAAPSRIEEARQRASVAKQAAVALAAAGFVAVLLLARASHAGTSGVSSTSGSSPSSSSSSTDSSTQSSDGFDYGSLSVAPSTATPQAQTSVS
jgi:hypothetical protein